MQVARRFLSTITWQQTGSGTNLTIKPKPMYRASLILQIIYSSYQSCAAPRIECYPRKTHNSMHCVIPGVYG